MSLADAHLPKPELSPFENKPVLRAAIEIPNAAGGLQEAMKFEPVELHHEEEVYVVLRCVVGKVRFDPIKDTNALARIHVFRAEEATLVDGDLVKAQLDAQRERIAEAKAAAEAEARRQKGEYTLEEEALETEHLDGQHASGLREGCPTCDEEAAAQQAENDDAERGSGFGEDDA